MTQIDRERRFERDRIAVTVDSAIDEMVKREDPHFYDRNDPNGEVMAVLVIAGLRRRSEQAAVLEAVSQIGCRVELARIWKCIEEMAAEAQADLKQQERDQSLNGRTHNA